MPRPKKAFTIKESDNIGLLLKEPLNTLNKYTYDLLLWNGGAHYYTKFIDDLKMHLLKQKGGHTDDIDREFEEAITRCNVNIKTFKNFDESIINAATINASKLLRTKCSSGIYDAVMILEGENKSVFCNLIHKLFCKFIFNEIDYFNIDKYDFDNIIKRESKNCLIRLPLSPMSLQMEQSQNRNNEPKTELILADAPKAVRGQQQSEILDPKDENDPRDTDSDQKKFIMSEIHELYRYQLFILGPEIRDQILKEVIKEIHQNGGETANINEQIRKAMLTLHQDKIAPLDNVEQWQSKPLLDKYYSEFKNKFEEKCTQDMKSRMKKTFQGNENGAKLLFHNIFSYALDGTIPYFNIQGEDFDREVEIEALRLKMEIQPRVSEMVENIEAVPVPNPNAIVTPKSTPVYRRTPTSVETLLEEANAQRKTALIDAKTICTLQDLTPLTRKIADSIKELNLDIETVFSLQSIVYDTERALIQNEINDTNESITKLKENIRPETTYMEYGSPTDDGDNSPKVDDNKGNEEHLAQNEEHLAQIKVNEKKKNSLQKFLRCYESIKFALNSARSKEAEAGVDSTPEEYLSISPTVDLFFLTYSIHFTEDVVRQFLNSVQVRKLRADDDIFEQELKNDPTFLSDFRDEEGAIGNESLNLFIADIVKLFEKVKTKKNLKTLSIRKAIMLAVISPETIITETTVKFRLRNYQELADAGMSALEGMRRNEFLVKILKGDQRQSDKSFAKISFCTKFEEFSNSELALGEEKVDFLLEIAGALVCKDLHDMLKSELDTHATTGANYLKNIMDEVNSKFNDDKDGGGGYINAVVVHKQHQEEMDVDTDKQRLEGIKAFIGRDHHKTIDGRNILAVETLQQMMDVDADKQRLEGIKAFIEKESKNLERFQDIIGRDHHKTIDGRNILAVETLQQGDRKNMEDSTCVRFDLGRKRNVCFFGCYDGHSGNKAAIHVKKYLVENLHEELLKRDEPNYEEALRIAFKRTNKDFLNIAESDNWDDGSCATTALLVGDDLFVANAGDCRTVLLQRDEAQEDPNNIKYNSVALSTDHKPSVPSEMERIANEGGMVMKGRVCIQVSASLLNTLAVSRAFGDEKFKNEKGGRYVISDPEIQVHRLKKGDDFLILACDGLWDTITNDQVAEIITKKNNIGNDTKAMSVELNAEAILRWRNVEGEDNVSSILLDLRRYHSGSEEVASGGDAAKPAEGQTPTVRKELQQTDSGHKDPLADLFGEDGAEAVLGEGSAEADLLGQGDADLEAEEEDGVQTHRETMPTTANGETMAVTASLSQLDEILRLTQTILNHKNDIHRMLTG